MSKPKHKPSKQTREIILKIRLTEDESARLEAKAQLAGAALSTWARLTLLSARVDTGN